jgi:GxxExxY protein
MPIETVKMSPVSEEQFHRIDFSVMKHAFNVHNCLGRFYDEDIYRDDLARLCRAVGLHAETEVPIRVVDKDFCKTYFMDLLIDRSVIYELKTVKGFDGSHRRQLLNYLFLCRLFHGKLANFRSSRVGSEFVSTTLDDEQRHIYELKLEHWRELDDESSRLKGVVGELLEDWGVFLEASLYSEAIVHFFGGIEHVEAFVDVHRDGEVIGRQKFRMLNEKTACFTTSLKHRLDYKKHLKSLIQNTAVQCIQWINFDKHNVEFVTVV